MHERLDIATATRFVRIVLDGVEREYPNHVMRLLTDDGDLAPPRLQTPAFFGCFDWHSAVHSHWTLLRLRRRFPAAEWAAVVEEVLERRLSREHLAAEHVFLAEPRNASFELPYGLAWLLQLGGELREAVGNDDTELAERSARWLASLEPLERLCRNRLLSWLRALPFPIRSGQHGQSAFSLGLFLDWARAVGDDEAAEAVAARTRALHAEDVDGPLAYEPSAYDFLSPCLAEADLFRRVADGSAFAVWLNRFLPGVPHDGSPWLEPVTCPDPSSGKLSHLDGLNLSRAWMLDGIAHALPAGDERLPALLAAASEHGSRGLDAVTGEHYAGAHWLPSFAVYLLTRRGIA